MKSLKMFFCGILSILCIHAPTLLSAQQIQATSPPAGAAITRLPASLVTASATANTLLDGTAVKLRLAENLSSATAKAGQSVPFEVLEDVDVHGVSVIAKGAQALATVTTAESKKSMGRAGKLDVNIDSVRLIDGEKAALSATQNAKGGGHTGAMTAGMVGAAIVFFPAAPLLLFIHGKDITIPKGTEVTAFVSGDMQLDMAKFAPVAPVAVVAGAKTAAASEVTIEASEPNCDIEVDGSFVGSTPSTLNLVLGKHEILVKKNGYQNWSRSMMVDSGAIRLSAEMVAKSSF
jgi:PEGA domain